MAKFTAGVPLNSEWQGHKFVGPVGTTYRLTDALVEEFTEEVVPVIPGFAWVSQDELTSVVTLPIAQADVTGLTAALAAKYDKSGGTISGSTTVTGTLSAGATTTGALQVNGAATVTSTLSAGATTTGALQVNGAATVTSTMVVTGAATAASTLRVGGVLTQIGAANLSSTLGVTGKVTMAQTAVLVTGGTAFPGSPANNDQFFRTDLDMWFMYNGTRWLCTCTHDAAFPNEITNLAASSTDISRRSPMGLRGGSDIWIEDLDVGYHVTSGTALSASHKWTVDIRQTDPGGGTSSIIVKTIDSGASATWRRDAAQAANILLGTPAFLFIAASKTGTPGNLYFYPTLTFRVVAT